MAPKIRVDDSDSDDAPEVVGLSSAQANAFERAKAVKEFQAAAAKKRKEANKARDAAQKAAAAAQKARSARAPTKSKGKRPARDEEDEDDDQGDPELLARMEKAMREAAEEDEEGLDDDGRLGPFAQAASGSDSEGEPDSDSQQSENGAGDDDEDGDEMEEGDEDDAQDSGSDAEDTPPRSRSKPAHLPDSFFAAAAAVTSAAKKSTPDASALSKRSTERSKRRRKASRSGKDIVVGTRIIRTIESSSHPVVAAVPRTTTKFMKNRLKAKKGRWERRPAHLTMSKGSRGPAQVFARGV